MNNRTRAAAVLTALAGAAAGVVTVAYQIAAEQTQSTVAEVAAESQGEVIRAASRLREMGLKADEALESIASHVGAPVAAVRALAAQRWTGNRPDPRQRYGRVGVLASTADVATVDAALAGAWCEPLTDPREGFAPHPRYQDCLASAPALLEPLCDAEGNPAGMGAQWQALPGDRVLLEAMAQQAGGVYVEGPGYDEANRAYDAALAALEWQRCPSPDEGTL